MKYAGETYHNVAPPTMDISNYIFYININISLDVLQGKRKRPEANMDDNGFEVKERQEEVVSNPSCSKYFKLDFDYVKDDEVLEDTRTKKIDYKREKEADDYYFKEAVEESAEEEEKMEVKPEPAKKKAFIP